MGLGVCVKFMLVNVMFMHVQLRCMLFLTIVHVYVLLYAFVMFPGFIWIYID